MIEVAEVALRLRVLGEVVTHSRLDSVDVLAGNRPSPDELIPLFPSAVHCGAKVRSGFFSHGGAKVKLGVLPLSRALEFFDGGVVEQQAAVDER
jgi:hypothetical protein